MNYSGIPYISDKDNKSLKRLLVEPLVKKETISDVGFITPEDAGKLCEEGKIISVCAGSVFKVGDIILYQKMPRLNKEEYDSVTIDDVEYDSIFETEVWSCNERPVNRLFAEPISDMQISEGGLILPDSTTGIPQKGRVYDAPIGSFFKSGDIVEYRKQEQQMYPTVSLNGKIHDVLFERDVYTVNESVAPHRIIVKIDMAAQKIKREAADGGLLNAPLFLFMLHNLQYGKVMDIGEEAQKIYPELKVGHTAILHHTVEHQKYRLLKQEAGKHKKVLFEYRMINAFDINEREIFGRIDQTKVYGKIPNVKIIPFGKNVFLKWEIATYEQAPIASDVLTDTGHDLLQCKDIDQFRNAIHNMKGSMATSYKMRYNSLIQQLGQCNPDIQEHRDHADLLETQILQLRDEAEIKGAYINSNHLLKCKIVAPAQIPNEVIVPYMQLYPINLFGTKYLIAHQDLIIATMAKKHTPLGNRILVLPMEEEKESSIILPDTAKERPQKGKVIAVGKEFTEPVGPGDTVLYKKLMGTEMSIDGVLHLMMRQNDILCKVEEDVVAEA